MMDDFHAGIESDDGVQVAVFDRGRIDLGNGFVKVDVVITAIEPPAGDLVATAYRSRGEGSWPTPRIESWRGAQPRRAGGGVQSIAAIDRLPDTTF